jgi:DNA processing protein
VVSDAIAAEITKGINHDALSDSLYWLSQPNNHLVTLADTQYPKALLEIADPPPFL